MSNIDKDVTMALTATRANRKPYTVHPFKGAPAPRQLPQSAPPPELDGAISDWADELEFEIDGATDRSAHIASFNAKTKTPEWEALRAADPARATAINTRATAKAKELAAA
jgi:hypothetical protein